VFSCFLRLFSWYYSFILSSCGFDISLNISLEYQAKVVARAEQDRIKVASERAIAALNLLEQLLSPIARLKRIESAHEMHEQLLEGKFKQQVRKGAFPFASHSWISCANASARITHFFFENQPGLADGNWMNLHSSTYVVSDTSASTSQFHCNHVTLMCQHHSASEAGSRAAFEKQW